MTADSGADVSGDRLDYQRAKQLAGHSDPKVRANLARRSDLRPELLYYLAGDPDSSVRRTIAINRATPGQADLLLARDRDADVRAELAAKIARLVPGLSAEERDHAGRAACEALDILARDQLGRVRQIIAETLQTLANAPADIVQRLARDADVNVAAPLLEFSPLLSDSDLLSIIRSGSARGGLPAIGRRTGLDEKVADAIAATKDVAAIAALLGNASAQIREETLDRLIDRAPMVESWHDPLCRRPRLPAGAVARLSRFVADHLLDVLQARRDLDADALAALSDEVHRRLGDTARVGFREDIHPPLDISARVGIVIRRIAIEYVGQAHYPGEVSVGTRVLRLGRSSYTLGHGGFQDGRCFATCELISVYADARAGKSLPLPESLRKALEAYT